MDKIKLVKLYNRLSFYFCLTNKPDLKETNSIDNLTKQLDELYEEYSVAVEEQKPKKGISVKKNEE